MIPKILHFIWIGEKIPDWGYNAIDNFKIVNPDFEIKLWHYKTLLNIDDKYLNECLPIFIDALNSILQKSFEKTILKYSDKNTNRMFYLCYNQLNYVLGKEQNKFIFDKVIYNINNIPNKLYSVIGDCLKFLILQKCGGIYLDLDTFPIKKFDNDLLTNDFFMCFHDVYFLGSITHDLFWFIKTIRLAHNHNVKMLDKYQRTNRELNTAFWNSTLKYTDDILFKNLSNNYQYIYHFAKRSWW